MHINQLKIKALDFISHRNSILRYEELLKSQYFSYDELCQIQKRKLKKIINHAYKTTEYYRIMMDNHKLKPDDIQNIEDLNKLPILTKEIIRNKPISFVSSNIKNIRPVNKKTGGSTGSPLEYLITRNVEGYLWGSIWRSWNVGGYLPGDKVVVFAGDSLVKKGLKHYAYHFLNNWECLGITNLDEDYLLNMFQVLKRNPKIMIYGYPTPLYLLARFMLRNDLKANINHIVTTSEMLFPEHRKIIEQGFECNVFDLYGANDGGALAFECEYFDGHHLCMEKVLTEIVDEHGKKVPDSTIGDILLTDLENYVMPLVRYKVGDRGSITNIPCKCNRGLNRLQKLSGRIKDYLELSNGKKIDGSYFTKRFRSINDIILFQIIQKSSKDIYAKVSLSNNTKPEIYSLISRTEKQIAKELGVNFQIRIDNSFERTTSQKFNYIVKM